MTSGSMVIGVEKRPLAGNVDDGVEDMLLEKGGGKTPSEGKSSLDRW